MQFLLFDVGVTLVFLGGYLTVVRLQRRKPRGAGAVGPVNRSPRREWPRLSYPR